MCHCTLGSSVEYASWQKVLSVKQNAKKKSALRVGQCVDVCSKYFRDLPTIFFSKRKRVTGEEVPGDARAQYQN